ncbi:MAG: type I-MYXAN CRISPR-associated Cas8a1/Cmx1 [Blastocatellia bacterium]
MVKELIYKLNNPNYTIYHRAALGGLAATVQAWKKNPPLGINAELTKDQVRLFWDNAISDQEALQRILAASFKLTKDKMIDLPGHGITEDKYGLRLAIHNGITSTFLQHPKMRPTKEKEARRVELKTADQETGDFFTYRPIDTYAHQQAQGTDLLLDKWKGLFPSTANITQSLVPGSGGGEKLNTPYDEAVLLFFLIVGTSIFLLRPRNYQEKAQACIVVPDVIDLVAFAKALHRIAQAGIDLKRFSNTYLNRVVGGAEEAALRFLIDLQTESITNERSVKGCQAIAMGKVAWDKNQVNRSISVSLENDYPELEIFQAAYKYLGTSKIIKTKKGENYAIPNSPVPELIAANLAAKRHWASHFINLVSDKKDFNNIRYSQGGLVAMKDAIKDEEDKLIIQVFQQAWKFTMGALYDRATRESTDPERLLEVERERMRNAILRTKNVDALSNWFLRFCADATKGNSLPSLAENSSQVRNFIFNQRNFERFQNLCLFALLSYKSDSKTTSGGKN